MEENGEEGQQQLAHPCCIYVKISQSTLYVAHIHTHTHRSGHQSKQQTKNVIVHF